MGEMRNAYKILVGKPEGKRHLGILSNRWMDNINTDLKQISMKVWTGFIWMRIKTSSQLL
jgi:hypothetical protein